MIRVTLVLAIINFIAGIFGITIPEKGDSWDQ